MTTWGVRKRYYCVNVCHCKYARAPDYAYSDADYRRTALCQGAAQDGCGATLIAGDSQDLRWRWLGMLILSLLAIGLPLPFALQYVNPPQLNGIDFINKSSQVSQGGKNGQSADRDITLTILRTGATDHAATVRYKTEDGTAKADQEYKSKKGALEFKPGEKSKSLIVQILANTQDTEKSFLVTLTNVKDLPQHSITITPVKPDPDAISKADALVRVSSNLAMDIADLYLRSKHLHRLLNSDALLPETRPEFTASLRSVDDNMEKASQRYLKILQDMVLLERGSVAIGFNNWDAHLDQKDMQQQKKATRIARQHYTELLQGGVPQTDLWAMQLSKVVPAPVKAGAGLQAL
jgi:hypothetical protein